MRVGRSAIRAPARLFLRKGARSGTSPATRLGRQDAVEAASVSTTFGVYLIDNFSALGPSVSPLTSLRPNAILLASMRQTASLVLVQEASEDLPVTHQLIAFSGGGIVQAPASELHSFQFVYVADELRF